VNRRLALACVLHGLILFGLLNSGAPREGWEALRARFEADPLGELTRDPLLAIRAFYHKDSDETLYFALTNLMLGEPADRRVLQATRSGREEDRRRVPGSEASGRPLLPYRDFSLEYPPLVLGAILLPRLFASTLEGYQLTFSLEMGCLAVLALWVGMRLARRLGALEPSPAALVGRATWGVFFLGLILVTRLDALVSLLLVTTFLLHVSGRTGWGAMALALATSAKLVPVLLAPLMYLPLIEERRWRELGRASVAFLATLIVVHLPFFLLAGEQFLEVFGHHVRRGLQIESLYATVVALLHHATGLEATVSEAFGSVNLEGPAAEAARIASPFLLLGAVVALTWHYLRTRRTLAGPWAQAHLVNHGVALALAIPCFGKVFSPQFLVWAYPLALLLRGRRAALATWLFLTACLLTQVVYPRLYGELERLALTPHALLALRTGLLLAVVVLAARAAVSQRVPFGNPSGCMDAGRFSGPARVSRPRGGSPPRSLLAGWRGRTVASPPCASKNRRSAQGSW
jgi:hypothetical protein